MNAARVHHFGPPDVITVEDIAPIVPGPGEVRVHVAAAGCGNWDSLVRRGESALSPPLPFTLGAELAGVIDAVGPDVGGLVPGDEIFGATNHNFTGAYGESAIVSADMVVRRPPELRPIDAASTPVIAVTARQMVHEQAQLGPGQTVLVLGAAGNVGAYAVQMAHNLGARVVAVVNGDGQGDELHALGADEVIDGSETRFEDRAGTVDAVIDTAGGDVQRRSIAAIKPGGILVSCVGPPDADLAGEHDVRTAYGIVQINTADLAQVAAELAGGQLRTRVGAVLPLLDVRHAHEMLDGVGARPRGKIVLSLT
jgi:NADPH:quinone reductase-like Zn-dependent oxidoreductase